MAPNNAHKRQHFPEIVTKKNSSTLPNRQIRTPSHVHPSHTHRANFASETGASGGTLPPGGLRGAGDETGSVTGALRPRNLKYDPGSPTKLTGKTEIGPLER